jgi:hypothetical protein
VQPHLGPLALGQHDRPQQRADAEAVEGGRVPELDVDRSRPGRELTPHRRQELDAPALIELPLDDDSRRGRHRSILERRMRDARPPRARDRAL